MEVRNVENNNLCECYHEELGYSVWVQSDETGLWFNMNDVLQMFNLSKSRLHWLRELAGETDKIIIEFYRENKVREYFISESMVHEVIAINRKESHQAEQFIYSIIKDYDTNVSTNNDELYYNTEQRMALHILQVDYDKFLEDHEEQIRILEGTPMVYEMQEFRDFIDWELNGCQMEYCKKRVPEDVREEERQSHMVNKPNKKEEEMIDDSELDTLFNAGC